jgi:hypothetical protein
LLYQNWLLEVAGKAGFRQKRVETGQARPRGDSYHSLPFTLRGQATLDELVQFLYDFYSAGHLHQIRRLTLKPSEKGKELEVIVLIEALSLPTAQAKEKLSQEPAKRLALGSLDAYRKAIQGRNVLAPYDPSLAKRKEKPEAGPKGPPFDPTKYAYVTGIVEVNGKPQVWVKARTTDDKFQLQQGEKLEIGPLRGTIARINPRDIEIEIDGKRHTVPLGGNVRGGEAEAKGQAEASGPKAEGSAPKIEGETRPPEAGRPKGARGRLKAGGFGPRPEGFFGPRPEGFPPGPKAMGPPPESSPK